MEEKPEERQGEPPPDVRAIAGPPPMPRRGPPPSAPMPTFGERVRAAPVTFAILLVNLAWFLWAEQHGSTKTAGVLLRFGAVEPIHVWAGEYWRVASYMFLHIGWVHLLWNSYAGFSICADVERALGRGRFLVAYLVSGVAGGCATVIVDYDAPSAGASGAMFGMIGALLALKWRELGSFRAFLTHKGTRATLVNAGIWLLIGTYVNFNNRAHFGGLVAGGVVTWVMTARARRLWGAVLGAALVAFFVASIKPWWKPSGVALEKLRAYGEAYVSGALGGDAARGERFLRRACAAGDAAACADLAPPPDLAPPR